MKGAANAPNLEEKLQVPTAEFRMHVGYSSPVYVNRRSKDQFSILFKNLNGPKCQRCEYTSALIIQMQNLGMCITCKKDEIRNLCKPWRVQLIEKKRYPHGHSQAGAQDGADKA